jgi:hypothetical protein
MNGTDTGQNDQNSNGPERSSGFVDVDAEDSERTVDVTDGGVRLLKCSRRRANSSTYPARAGFLHNTDLIPPGTIYAQPRYRRKQAPESFANAVEDTSFRNESGRSVVQEVVSEITPFQPLSGLNQQLWSVSAHVDRVTLYLDHLHMKTVHSPHKSVGGGVLQELDHFVADSEFSRKQIGGVAAEDGRSIDTGSEQSEGSQ